jgi:hypothetical protein
MSKPWTKKEMIFGVVFTVVMLRVALGMLETSEGKSLTQLLDKWFYEKSFYSPPPEPTCFDYKEPYCTIRERQN